MIVICLEGCHGAGKTELCKAFASKGFEVLDEGFLDMPEYALHPQSLLMETTWVCSWFERVLRKAQEESRKGTPSPVFIADRSPYSAVFYSKRRGELLEPLIREHIREVREAANIEVYTVHVDVDKEVLWKRIEERLERQPERAQYNEQSRTWMEETTSWYDQFSWDMTVTNNLVSIEHTRNAVMRQVAARSPRFCDMQRKASSESLAELNDIVRPASGDSLSPPPALFDEEALLRMKNATTTVETEPQLAAIRTQPDQEASPTAPGGSKSQPAVARPQPQRLA